MDEQQAWQEAAQRNREQMPLTARAVDRLRSIFGTGCTVIHAWEGERAVGVEPRGQRSMNVDQWLVFVRSGEVPAGKERPAP